MTITALKNPACALGTWAWGDSGAEGEGYFGSGTSQAGFDEIAGQAQAAGFTLWDTATVYGMGRAEERLGRTLQHYPRSSYQLSTKFTPQAAGSGPDPVADMLEQSLARMGTAYIDLYWIHNPADVERWTPRLVPLLQQGKVRHVGVSNHNLAQILRADQVLRQSGFRVEAVQNHFSLLHRDAERSGVLDHCNKHGIAFFAYMVLEQGALSGKYGAGRPLPEGTDRARHYNELLPRLDTLTRTLSEVGQRHGAGVPQAEMAWAMAKGTVPVVGVTRADHIASLSRASRLVLTPQDIAALESVADAAKVNTRGWWEQEARPA